MSTTAGEPPETLLVFGLSRETAPVQIRERAALDAGAARAVLGSLRASGLAEEALVLSTCIRTEVYVAVAADLGADASGVVKEAIAAHTQISAEELQQFGYVLRDRRATEHVFGVVAGLCSTVLGEGEIVAQARAAVALAEDQGTLGRLLEGLFQQAAACGRRVRSSTGISRGVKSISSVAVELAEELLGDLAGRRALVIGAGTVASAAARRFALRSVDRLVIANRGQPSAASLARRVGGHAVSLTALHDELRRADVLLCATRAPRPIVSRETLLAATRDRGDTLVALDLALPRDIEPTARTLPRVALRDLDEIQRIAAGNVDGRRKKLPLAWSIVRAEAQRFEAWRAGLEAEPLIKELRRRAEDIRRCELDRLIASYPNLDDSELRRLDAATRSLTNRLLHEPTVRLRQAGSTRSGRRRLEGLHDLFGDTDTTSAPKPSHHGRRVERQNDASKVETAAGGSVIVVARGERASRPCEAVTTRTACG